MKCKVAVAECFLRSLNYLNFQDAHKNNKRAFSVAEAMMALLIGSVALGMAAPMITKQVKSTNMREVQIEVLQQTIIPSGAIMFFDRANCPDGWTQLDSRYNGRYLKVAGSYTVCDRAGENRNGGCAGSAVTTVTDNNIGVFTGDAIRNIEGEFSAYEMGRYGVADRATGPFTIASYSGVKGASSHSGTSPVFTFNASRVVPTASENRPRSVSLLACRKR